MYISNIFVIFIFEINVDQEQQHFAANDLMGLISDLQTRGTTAADISTERSSCFKVYVTILSYTYLKS